MIPSLFKYRFCFCFCFCFSFVVLHCVCFCFVCWGFLGVVTTSPLKRAYPSPLVGVVLYIVWGTQAGERRRKRRERRGWRWDVSVASSRSSFIYRTKVYLNIFQVSTVVYNNVSIFKKKIKKARERENFIYDPPGYCNIKYSQRIIEYHS